MRSMRSALSCLLLVCLLSACATTEKSGAAPETVMPQQAASLQHPATLKLLQDDYRDAELQMEATQEALTDLSLSPIPDLHQAYQVFAAHERLMEELGEPLLAHADGMHYGGPAYIVEDVKDASGCPLPGMGGLPNLQPVELGDQFEVISEEAWAVKRAYRDYQSDIYLISSTLWNNLSPNTVNAMEKMIRKAEVDSDSLSDALGRVRDAVAAAEAAKAQQAAPPPVVPQPAQGGKRPTPPPKSQPLQR